MGSKSLQGKREMYNFLSLQVLLCLHKNMLLFLQRLLQRFHCICYLIFLLYYPYIVLCCQTCFPPPKPSWNKRFYLTTSIVRNIVFSVGQFRSLTGIRFLTSGGVPPSSPLLPRGLFSKLGDSLVPGSALPAYEYIYSNDSELQQLFPTTTPLLVGSRNKIILYFHGGAFCWQSLASHRMMLYAMAKATGATILSIEYRKAPEHPYPLPGQDCFEAYKWLLQKIGDSSRIVVAGDSAGGALAIDVILMTRDGQLPRPAGSILLSPWVLF